MSKTEFDVSALTPGGTLGIDPGSASGAIAYVTETSAHAWPIGELTDAEVWHIVRSLVAVAHAVTAVIERVGAMPKQGVSSTFKFGANYGMLRMALTASGVTWTEVAPAVWQRAMGCRTKGDKRVSRMRAAQLFPQLRITQKTADALLLALYARNSVQGQIVPQTKPQKPKRPSKREMQDALAELLG